MTKSKPTHDAVYRSGSFTGRDGNERNAYRTIGAAWPDQNGAISSIRLESIPVQWDGVLYLRQRDDAEAGSAEPIASGGGAQ